MLSGCSKTSKEDEADSINKENLQEENGSKDQTTREPFLLCAIDYAQK
jgi:hypothetical protein